MTPADYGPGRNPAMGPVSGVVGLTATRKYGARTEQVLAFLREYIGEKGYPPSVRDIMRGCGLVSTAAADYHIKKLVALGAIRQTPRVARGIALVDGSKEGGERR